MSRGVQQYQLGRRSAWPNAHGFDERERPRETVVVYDAETYLNAGYFESEARAARQSVWLKVDVVVPQRRPRPVSVWPVFNAGRRSQTVENEKVDLEAAQPQWSSVTLAARPESTKALRSGSWNTKRKEKTVIREAEKQIAKDSLVDQDVLDHAYDGSGEKDDPYLVEWLPDDRFNPLTYGKRRKNCIALVLGLATHMVSIATSGFSQGTASVEQELHVSTITTLLITSTFAIGFAFGALVICPLSEMYGRRWLFVSTFGLFTLFTGTVSLSPSIVVILTLRFAAGAAGAFTQTVAPALISDIFEAQDRGTVLCLFTLAGLMGQCFGPIVAGFLSAAYGWRSIGLAMAAACLPIWTAMLFVLPETFTPILLQRRADYLTSHTSTLHTVHPSLAGPSQQNLTRALTRVILRPCAMLIFSPIILLLATFFAIIHGTLFILFASYPILYQSLRPWPQGIASLPFLAVALGIALSVAYVRFYEQRRYAILAYTLKPRRQKPQPESRLPPAILGSLALVVGIFWSAWTSPPSFQFMIPVSAGVLFGFGMTLVYMALTGYLVDAFGEWAGSALAATTVTRSLGGAVFPLAVPGLYRRLGTQWAGSVPGFAACVFVPVLWGLMRWGAGVRGRGRFASGG